MDLLLYTFTIFLIGSCFGWFLKENFNGKGVKRNEKCHGQRRT